MQRFDVKFHELCWYGLPGTWQPHLQAALTRSPAPDQQQHKDIWLKSSASGLPCFWISHVQKIRYIGFGEAYDFLVADYKLWEPERIFKVLSHLKWQLRTGPGKLGNMVNKGHGYWHSWVQDPDPLIFQSSNPSKHHAPLSSDVCLRLLLK